MDDQTVKPYQANMVKSFGRLKELIQQLRDRAIVLLTQMQRTAQCQLSAGK
jgi:hypothetical protein